MSGKFFSSAKGLRMKSAIFLMSLPFAPTVRGPFFWDESFRGELVSAWTTWGACCADVFDGESKELSPLNREDKGLLDPNGAMVFLEGIISAASGLIVVVLVDGGKELAEVVKKRNALLAQRYLETLRCLPPRKLRVQLESVQSLEGAITEAHTNEAAAWEKAVLCFNFESSGANCLYPLIPLKKHPTLGKDGVLNNLVDVMGGTGIGAVQAVMLRLGRSIDAVIEWSMLAVDFLLEWTGLFGVVRNWTWEGKFSHKNFRVLLEKAVGNLMYSELGSLQIINCSYMREIERSLRIAYLRESTRTIQEKTR